MRRYTKSAEERALREIYHAGPCVWPQCERPVWAELEMPICSFHSAKVYLKMQDHRPPTPRVNKPRPADDLLVGVVYYAESADGLIKIGFSRGNLGKRMRELKISLLAATPGTTRDERAAHMEFGEYWEFGEYFRPGPRLIERVNALRGPRLTRLGK